MSVSIVDSKRSDARGYLLKADAIRVLLFEITRKRGFDKNRKALLSTLLEMASECDQPEATVETIRAILNDASQGRVPTSEDLALAASALDDSSRMLEDYLQSQQHLDAPVSEAWSDRVKGYRSAFDSLMSGSQARTLSRDRSTHLAEVQALIYRQPGRFIYQLYETLNPNSDRDGFSYASVHNYVETLVNERRVLTVGGAQGVPRYCYPNPQVVKDRARYYGGPWAVEGKIEEEVTEEFDFSHLRSKFVDIYVANESITPSVYLVAEQGTISAAQNKKVRSAGTIHRFDEFRQVLGLAPQASLRRKEFLVADQVFLLKTGGIEQSLWRASALAERENLTVPSLERST